MAEELTNLIASTVTSGIKPQLLQIANLEIIKYVNTGDRVKDGAVVIIVNGLVTLLFAIIYYVACVCKTFIVKKYYCGSDTSKINVKQVLATISEKDVEQYKYVYTLKTSNAYGSYIPGGNDITMSMLQDYITHKNNVDEINVLSQIKLIQKNNYVYATSLDVNQLPAHGCIFNTDTQETTELYFMPVEMYTSLAGRIEYIFVYKGKLMSQSLSELHTFIKNVLQYKISVNKELKTATDTKQGIYEWSVNGTELNGIYMGELNKHCTFDNLYIHDKPLLLKWINKFKDKTLYPKGLPLVNKLGILLYGPSGTGKTGCISALANYLGKSVVIVKSLTLKRQGQNTLKKHISSSNNIIVFDEFDYILNAQEDNEMDKWKEMLATATTPEEKKRIITLMETQENDLKNAPLDNRFILDLLDGVGNDEGRIIIATTNNPHLINPLFLRPGRFDVIMELGYCTFEMCKDIIRTKYIDDELDANTIHKVVELNITPLVLINNLVVSNSVQDLFQKLLLLPKQEYKHKPIN